MPTKLLMAIVALGAAASGGCATMFTGSAEQVTVSSSPAGARVFVNGGYTGVTPVALLLKTERDHVVTLQREGYQDLTAAVYREFNPVAVLNLFSPICWIIDVATGALWRLTPRDVHLMMQPLGMPGVNHPPLPPPGVIWGAPPVAPSGAPSGAPSDIPSSAPPPPPPVVPPAELVVPAAPSSPPPSAYPPVPAPAPH